MVLIKYIYFINIIKEDLTYDNQQSYAGLDDILKQKFESNPTVETWFENWKNLIRRYEKSRDVVQKSKDTITPGQVINSQTNIGNI